MFGGLRIRLTACKRVPNQFEKFTFSIPTHSGSPSQDKVISSPIHAPDPRGKQAQPRDPRGDPITQARDLVRGNQAQTRDSRAQENPTHDPHVSPLKRDLRLLIGPTREIDLVHVSSNVPGPFVQGLTRVTHQFGPIRPFSIWVLTRNPNLGFSSPSKVRFRPFKRRYDQYSEENYFGGYPNPHFCYKRF